MNVYLPFHLYLLSLLRSFLYFFFFPLSFQPTLKIPINTYIFFPAYFFFPEYSFTH